MAGCADTEKPGEHTKTNSSDCVSFNADLTKMRVRLPDIEMQTAFAQVLGHETITTSGEAEVELVPSTKAGGVLPFGLPWAVSGDIEVCLKSGANPKVILRAFVELATLYGELRQPRNDLAASHDGG